MGLHDVLMSNWLWVYRWYNAYNARIGRAHLFKVPLVMRRWYTIPEYDLDYMSDTEIATRVRNEHSITMWAFPGFFRGDVPSQPFYRQCHTRQQAAEWESPYRWDSAFRLTERPRRGWCEVCWNLMTELPDNATMPFTADEQRASAPRYFAEQTMEEWLRTAAGWRAEEPRGQREL